MNLMLKNGRKVSFYENLGSNQKFSSEQTSIRIFDTFFKREKNLYIAPGNMMMSTKHEAGLFVTVFNNLKEGLCGSEI